MRYPILLTRFLLIGLVSALPLAAQSEAAASAESADALFQAQDWPAAEKAYAAVVEEAPDNGQALMRLGVTRLQQGKPEQALAPLERALELGFQVPFTLYYGARAHAGSGNAKEAVAWLDRMVDGGAKPHQAVAGAKEFRAIAETAEFQRVLARMLPCNEPAYRQFDFWLGEWTVESPDGSVAQSRISASHNGCVLREEYEGGNSTGTSLNFYDSASGKWHQTWIDDQGRPLWLIGGFEDDKMVLSSADPDKVPFDRITWTPLEGGKVRQVWEQSTDGGKTWTEAFEGVYSPRSTKP